MKGITARAVRHIVEEIFFLLKGPARDDQPERKGDEERIEQIGAEACSERTEKAKADVPVGRVTGKEPERLVDQEGQHEIKEQDENKAESRIIHPRQIIQENTDADDQVALQNRHRVCRIVEGVTVEERIFIEVPAIAHLCPWCIDAECQDRQERIHDPDPEIFSGISGERGLIAIGFRIGGRSSWRLRAFTSRLSLTGESQLHTVSAARTIGSCLRRVDRMTAIETLIMVHNCTLPYMNYAPGAHHPVVS